MNANRSHPLLGVLGLEKEMDKIRDLGFLAMVGGVYGALLINFWPAPEVGVPGLLIVPGLWWALFHVLKGGSLSD